MKIDPMYEKRPRVTQNFSKVQLLLSCVTFHTLPLFYLLGESLHAYARMPLWKSTSSQPFNVDFLWWYRLYITKSYPPSRNDIALINLSVWNYIAVYIFFEKNSSWKQLFYSVWECVIKVRIDVAKKDIEYSTVVASTDFRCWHIY